MSLPVRLPAPSKANDNLISISTHPGAPMSHKPIKQEICDTPPKREVKLVKRDTKKHFISSP